jgi:hypothetical protein
MAITAANATDLSPSSTSLNGLDGIRCARQARAREQIALYRYSSGWIVAPR